MKKEIKYPKISEAQKLRHKEHPHPKGMSGKKQSLETRQKMSISRKGRVVSKETCKKISDARKKRKLELGYINTEETRQKISRTQIGKIVSEETRQKMSVSQTGRKHSEETRNKMSVSQRSVKKKPLSEKHRLSLRKAVLEDWVKKENIWPNYNLKACEWFKRFDEQYNTKGIYAVYGGGEFYIKELGFWVDYINHDLKLIIEWDEKWHFKNGKLRSKDTERQNKIMNYLPEYAFKRVKEI